MPDQQLNGYRVAIIATDLFEESELTEPLHALRQAGADVKVIAPKSGQIQAVQHDRKTQQIDVDMALEQADPSDFDAVMLPGGAMNADALRVEKKAQEFVRRMDSEGCPIAVICHGPWLLVSAGLVRGRHMTSYHTIQDDLKNAGANWEDSECVVDRNWVSSRQPSDLRRFNQEMVRVFSQHKSTARKAA